MSGVDSAGIVVASGGGARILEPGYRPYRGARRGTGYSVWALARHTFERIVGLHRPARYKVLPALTLLIAYLPAIAFIGIVAIINLLKRPVPAFVPGPGDYYGFVTAAILLFAVVAAPEALCPDRHCGFLGVYLASPLTRRTYLAAKGLAVICALMIVTLGPPLLLLAGEALQNDGPRGEMAFFIALGRVVGAGVALAVMIGAFSLVVPALTTRRAFAAAGTLLAFLATGALAGTLNAGLGGPDAVQLLALGRLPFELALRIFGKPGLPTGSGTPLPAVWVYLASAGLTLAAALTTWWRIAAARVAR